MDNNLIIRVITEEAKEIEASVISLFEILENQNKYAIYTFNEEDAQGLVKIYASRIMEVDGLYTFTSIADSEEWGRIKSIMKYMAKDGGDGTDNGTIKLISANQVKSQMNEPISVNLSETKAAKIGPNYKTGITNCYVNNVKEEVSTVVAPEPEVEIPQPVIEPVEIPTVEEEPTPINVEIEEPKAVEIPEVDIATFVPEIPVFEPTPVADVEFSPIEMPTVEEEKVRPEVEEKEEFKPSFDFEVPKYEEEKEEEVEDEVSQIKEMPSVDSVLSKASYYQNIPEEKEEKRDESNENIIQSIGLEFMKKVSELAEYEKELNKRNRDLEAKERLISKLEKELVEREERQKSAMLSTREKEKELRKAEKELADKDNDLNRRIMEFNKKISMFQQTFETISKVD
ncbi:MAG: hypothetical protein E7166_04990 [Firmicutes bacterium]|nr:hypothetical protein [Bacillota bacterium]